MGQKQQKFHTKKKFSQFFSLLMWIEALFSWSYFRIFAYETQNASRSESKNFLFIFDRCSFATARIKITCLHQPMHAIHYYCERRQETFKKKNVKNDDDNVQLLHGHMMFICFPKNWFTKSPIENRKLLFKADSPFETNGFLFIKNAEWVKEFLPLCPSRERNAKPFYFCFLLNENAKCFFSVGKIPA